ncbi:MAG TPA: hypothetical protein VF066_01870 [Thermoleophilaceae bacterium]
MRRVLGLVAGVACLSGCGTAGTEPTSAPVTAQPAATTTTADAPRARPQRRRLTRAQQEKAMVGDWVAVGTVLRVKNMHNLIHGDSLGERQWRIGRVCRRHRCRMVLTRQTSLAPLATSPTRVGDHWVATYDQRLPMANGEIAVEHSVWRLDLHGPRIAAMERAHTTSCQCHGSALVVRWVATK